MTRTNRRTVVFGLWALVVAGGMVPCAGAAESAADDPLQIVPPESLFCIKINNLNTALSQMDQFLTGISPFGLSMMVQSQFARLLGSPDPNSVNKSGAFAVFGPLPGGEAPDLSRIGILVPVSDYQKFVKSNPNVTPPDAQGISRIGPEGQQKLVAVSVAGYALVTGAGNRQALTEVKSWMPRGTTSLAQRLGSEELKRATDSPVWAYANLQTVHKMFGPMIQAKIQQAKETFQSAAGGPTQGQPMMGQMGAMIDVYATLLNSLMQETQFVSLSLHPSAGAIRAGLMAAAVPQTEMAKVLTGSPGAPDRSFLRYLENGAVMNIITAVDTAQWNRFNDMYLNLFAQLTGKQASDPEIRRVRKTMMDFTNAVGGTLAGSFSVDIKAKPPFAMQYVVGLKDAQAFYRALEEMPNLSNTGPIADFYKQMGFKLNVKLQRKAETYEDVAIDAVQVNVEPTDPNAPAGQAISAMSGQGLNGRIAVANNLLLYVFAAQPLPMMQELIDQVKTPGAMQTISSELQAAMQLIPESEKADCFITYNYLRVLQMVTAMMPMPIAPTAVKSQSNIAITADASDGKLAVQMAIPKQHVQEIMMVFMQIQQQKMQEPQQGQPNQN